MRPFNHPELMERTNRDPYVHSLDDIWAHLLGEVTHPWLWEIELH